jgi:sugar phosphate isomerase/epimerase
MYERENLIENVTATGRKTAMQSATQQTPKTIQGPAIFLAQFLGPEAPFNSLEAIASWAEGLCYKGVQLPTLDERIFNLALAAESRDYCDEVTGTLKAAGLALTELSTHIQGQLVAVHPAYDLLFDGFAPEAVRGKPAARQEWAVGQLQLAARASANLGLKAHASFSGALAWPYLYPWPQRPPGLVETAFAELARRWRPILNAFEEAGTDVCFELHPGEDLHDGATFERFLEATGNHPRCNILYDPSHFLLQQMDYLGFIDAFHDRIRAFHVKDAEFNPTAKSGVYGGFQSWLDRPGRFRSLGDGQIDFNGIFSRLTRYGFPGWAVLEWECCLKDSQQGAAEGAPFIEAHLIQATGKAFDDFAAAATNQEDNRRLLGLK